MTDTARSSSLWGNPLLAQEWRSSLRALRKLGRTPTGRVSSLSLGIAAYLAVLYWLGISLAEQPAFHEDYLQPIALFCLVGICLLAPASTAVSIAGERQKGTWDLLLMTSLRPRDIILGKFAGRVLGVLAPVLLAAPLLIVIIALTSTTPEVVTAASLTLPTTLFGLAGLGLLCSALCRTGAAARAMALGIAAVLIVGIPMLEVLWLSVSGASGNDGPILSCITCPFISWLGITESLSDHGAGWDGAALGFLGPLFYAVVGLVSLRTLIGRFDGLLRLERVRGGGDA